MATNGAGIQQGMAVFASDGERLGAVTKVPARAQHIRKELDSLPANGLRAEGAEVADMADPAITATTGDQRIEALGGLGGKGRGSETDTNLVAQRGDPRSLSGKDRGTEPQAGGMDLLRGYGMQRGDAGSAGGHVTSAAAGSYGQHGELPAVTNVSTTSSFEASRDAGSFVVEGAEPHTGILRVPLSAVAQVVPGERVTLTCTGADCRNLYGGNPGPEAE